MDNKKWYKRISTCFWFFLATMPVIIPLISMVVQCFVHLDSISNIVDINDYINNHNFYNQLESFMVNMRQLLPNSFINTFTNVFINFDLSEVGSYSLGFICAWFVWAYIIELVVDIIVWLPRLFHKWLDRWCD